MKRMALTLMVLTLGSKFIGFAREIVLSYFYGTSNISDAYLIALTIPTVIFSFIGIAIQTTYIPLYTSVLKECGNKDANKFTNSVINMLLIASTIIIVVVFLFPTSFVKLFASGFEGETLDLATKFTQVTIFSIYFIGLTYVFRGYLQSQGNFIGPALIGFPMNFLLMVSIILSYKYNVKILAYGKLLAVLTQVIFLIPFLYKKKYYYSFDLDTNNKYLKKMIYLTLPVMLGTSVNQINKLVDRTLASQVAIGGISALNYANRLNKFVQGIFVMAIATILFATISKMSAEKNMIGLKKTLSEAINGVNLLVIPTTIGAMIFAEPIVRLLFGRGAFDLFAVSMTSDALFFYSIGMIGYAWREVLSRTFYSLHDTKAPMINATIGMVINIVLNIILAKYLGVGGLALATSLAAIFTSFLLFTSLRKKIGPFGLKSITISFFKILVSSIIMGIIAKVSFNNLLIHISENTSLLISICIGILVYFTIIYFMKIDDVDIIINILRKKFKKCKEKSGI